MTFDGQLYGIPYAVENIALFRNTDLVPTLPDDHGGHRRHGQGAGRGRQDQEIMSLQIGQTGDAVPHLSAVRLAAAARSSARPPAATPIPTNVTVDSAESIAAGELIGRSARRATRPSRPRSTTPTPSRCSSTRRPRSWSPDRGRSPTSRRPASIRHLPDPGLGGQEPAGPFIGVNGFYLASKGKNKALAQEFATNFLTTQGRPGRPLRGGAAPARR